jgi:membrane dipeptidase
MAGGATCCVVTASSWRTARTALAQLAKMHRFVREHADEVVLATSVAEIREAKRTGRLAVVLQFQGPQPIEDDVSLVDLYWRLGIRVIQLAYNRRNLLCDGCQEPSDAGLSSLGRDVIRELNRLGILVDVSHTGVRSSLDAAALSTQPCIASHSNVRALCASNRNLPDEVIKAIAGTGGVIGINGFPAFVARDGEPTVDAFIDHMVYIDDLVGPGHVALGIDYWATSPEDYQERVRNGIWDASDYPAPPWRYPEGIETPELLGNLTTRLRERGYDEAAINGILGENWLRVFGQVCSGVPAEGEG